MGQQDEAKWKGLPLGSGEPAHLMEADPSLVRALDVVQGQVLPGQQSPRFSMFKGALYWEEGEVRHWQLVIPQPLRQRLLYPAHNVPFASHQATRNTLARIFQWFYWLGVYTQVARYCAACLGCQLTQPRGARGGLPAHAHSHYPIQKDWGIELVGPLTPSSGRHHFIMVVVDYATRYLEAMSLHNAKAPMEA